jgi:hypothetical protein
MKNRVLGNRAQGIERKHVGSYYFSLPLGIQIAHLFVADAFWTSLVASTDLVSEPAITCPGRALATVVKEGPKR